MGDAKATLESIVRSFGYYYGNAVGVTTAYVVASDGLSSTYYFDGTTWQTYLPKNSGFSGAEAVALTLDQQGRVWVGTRTAGIDLYQMSK